MATKHEEKKAEPGAEKPSGTIPAGVQDQINHGGLSADDPKRNPAPETIDSTARAEQLKKEDRERHDHQGDK